MKKRIKSMGSCVSRSRASSEAAESSVHALTAKVVDLDGSMSQFAAPVTAHEALTASAASAGRASPPASFLCCSDELDFEAPVRALGARDALRPGQLYFVLPASMLGRPLSAQDMAALAVRACAALGTSPVVSAVDGSEAGRKQRRRETTGRVAPVVAVTAHADGEWKSGARKAESGDRTVGKARQGAVGTKGVGRRLAAVQRLSAIVEADSE